VRARRKTGHLRAALLGALLLLVMAAATVRAQQRTGSPASAIDPLELVIVVHPSNGVVLSASDIESIFLLKRRRWADGTPIIPFNLASGIAPRRLFDITVLRMTMDEVAHYWLDERIRSGTRAPRQLDDASLALRLAARVPGAIVYAPASALVGHPVRVVARIRGGHLLPP
jgi:hypothetical protein